MGSYLCTPDLGKTESKSCPRPKDGDKNTLKFLKISLSQKLTVKNFKFFFWFHYGFVISMLLW